MPTIADRGTPPPPLPITYCIQCACWSYNLASWGLPHKHSFSGQAGLCAQNTAAWIAAETEIQRCAPQAKEEKSEFRKSYLITDRHTPLCVFLSIP